MSAMHLRIKVSKFLKLSNKTAVGIILWDTLYNRLPTNKLCQNWISVSNILHQLILSLRCAESLENTKQQRFAICYK